MLVLIFLSLLGSVYAYSGWRLIPYLPPPAQIGAASALVLLLFLPLLLFRLRSLPHLARLTDPLAWIAYLGIGLFTVCSTLLVLRDLGGLSGASSTPSMRGSMPASTWRPSSWPWP